MPQRLAGALLALPLAAGALLRQPAVAGAPAAANASAAQTGGPAARKARAAMCVAGNARSFPDLDVAASLLAFQAWLGVAGLNESVPRPDTFAFLTLGNEHNKKDYSRPAAAESREQVEAALAQFSPVAATIQAEAGEVTLENLNDYLKPNATCFRVGWWAQNDMHIVRGVNQLLHVQKCLMQIRDHEQRSGKAYEIVMIARPDLKYSLHAPDITPEELIDRASRGLNPHVTDFFMALDRAGMDRLLEPNRAMPLTCYPGERCCGRADRPEQLFAQLLHTDFHWYSSVHLGNVKRVRPRRRR